jgi:DNA-binding CsgD family transcriptional regulator
MAVALQERERELGAIARALDSARDGLGAALVVLGPAGIGKTSVLEAAKDLGRERDLAVAVARASPLETAYPWGVLRQLLERRLRGMPGAERARMLAGVAAVAGPVVLPEGAPDEPGVSFGMLHGLYWLVAGLAARRPLLLVVDDLHWADAASAGFLEFLANRVDELPVVLLAAARPGATAPAHATALRLSPLSPAGTAALLGSAQDEFTLACHEAAGGNPLLLRRLADALPERDAGAVSRFGPEAVADAVLAALARTGDEPARLARALAVLERAPLAIAARLAGLEPDGASAVAEELARAGILRDARPLEFAHGLIRDAVASGLSAGERTRLHAAAARLLAEAGAAPEAVAVHLLHVEPAGDASVAAALAGAGRRALAAGAPAEAAALLARAAAEPVPEEERSALALDRARAENALGRPEALDRVLEAHALARDPVEGARAALALMWASRPGRQDPGEPLALVEEAIRGVDGHDRELGLRLQAVRLTTLFLDGTRLAEALGEAERFAGLPGRTIGECELLAHVALHRFLLGRPAADVAEPLERAVTDPALVAAIGPDSAWLFSTVGGLFKTDRLDAARRTLDAALAEARRRASAPGFSAVSAWRAWIALREGDGASAEAEARAAYAPLPPGTWHRVLAGACLVEVLVERAALDEAEAVLAELGRDDAGERSREWQLFPRSILLAARGDAHGALAAQLESRGLRGGGTDPDPDFDGWCRIARLLHATGDERGAAAEAGAALRWAKRWGTPGHIGQAMVVGGLVRGDVEELRDAVAHLERSPARRELAGALVELGAALRRGGERVAAREPLRRALDIAAAGGLVATGERAREELRIAGARPRRDEASGLASLTPSELRIAGLAADGATNAEIAQSLFVTVKTVEMHLGNAYRKLGIRSRAGLVPLVAGGKPWGTGTGSSP